MDAARHSSAATERRRQAKRRGHDPNPADANRSAESASAPRQMGSNTVMKLMRRPAESWAAVPRAAAGAPTASPGKQTTPWRRLIATAAALFVAEALVMALLMKLPLRPPFEIAIDAALLVILTIPALYFFLVRPLARQSAARRGAEETTRQSEERYRAIFDTAANLITSVDRRGVIVDCNAQISSFLGYTRGQIVGLPMSKIIHPDYLAKAEESLAEILVKGVTYDREYKMVRRDGSLIDVSINSSALRDDHGEWAKTVCIISDVTTARRMEEAVRNAYAELELVFNAAGDGMRVVDLDFNVIRVNDTYAEMSLESKQAVVNRKCYEDFPAPACHTPQCTLQRIKEGRERVECEVEKERTDGSKITCMLTATALRNRENRLLGMVEDFKDITELRKTREHLQHSQVLASLGEMTAGIAHEVNNPLGSILLYSELLVASDIQPRVRKDLRIIHDEAKRAAQVMTDLLAYSRKVKPQTRRLDLHKVLKKLVSMRRYSQKVQNITVETDFQPAPLYVSGDSARLRQLFMNLVLNAEEAVKECAERRIKISASTEGDWAKIAIADTGQGIPQENLKQIFYPFFTTKATGEGTGLGLSTCYGIVTDHHGLIVARNNPEGGATFVVDLPLAPAKGTAELVGAGARTAQR